jgi:hypothetical protein
MQAVRVPKQHIFMHKVAENVYIRQSLQFDYLFQDHNIF